MRIVVNDIAASKTGALSILKDFYAYVREHDTENEWIFVIGGSYLQETPRIKVIIRDDVKSGWKRRLQFEFLTGSRFLESLRPDVVFSMQNTLTRGAIRRKDGSRVPQILYVHQPLGFQRMKRFSFLKSEEREYAVYQYLIGAMIDSSVKRADKVIVQTEWMKEAVAEKTHRNQEDIVKILPDVEDLSAYRMEGEFQKNEFFFPSGEILYKNHECILKAASILNEKGITDFKVRFTLKGLSDVTNRTYEDPFQNVEWMGRISREEVFSFYRTGTLIFPSYIETFGIPLAEARQMNTLILASDCPFCHEVLDGYENAYYFHPFHEEELASLMEKVIRGQIGVKPSRKAETVQTDSYGQILEVLSAMGK